MQAAGSADCHYRKGASHVVTQMRPRGRDPPGGDELMTELIVPLGGSIAILVVLNLLNWGMPKFILIDNVLSLIITFFGVVGPVSMLLPGFSAGMYNLIASGVSAASDGPASSTTSWTIFWVWFWAIVGAAIVMFPGRSFGGRLARLALFVPLSIALYQFGPMVSMMEWYIEGPATAVGEFFGGAWNKLTS